MSVLLTESLSVLELVISYVSNAELQAMDVCLKCQTMNEIEGISIKMAYTAQSKQKNHFPIGVH